MYYYHFSSYTHQPAINSGQPIAHFRHRESLNHPLRKSLLPWETTVQTTMSSPSRPDYNLLALGPPSKTWAMQRSKYLSFRFVLIPSRSTLAGKDPTERSLTQDWYAGASCRLVSIAPSFLPCLATWESFCLSCFSLWWDLWWIDLFPPSILLDFTCPRSILPLVLERCCHYPQTQCRCLSAWCQVARRVFRMIVHFLWRRIWERRGGRDGECPHCRNTDDSSASSKRRRLSKPVLRVDGNIEKHAMLGEVTINVIL